MFIVVNCRSVVFLYLCLGYTVLKGKAHKLCVSSCMIFGSRIWLMKTLNDVNLHRMEMSMIRWMV